MAEEKIIRIGPFDYELVKGKVNDFEAELLGKGWRSRLRLWWKKREIMNDDHFARDVQAIKLLFGGKDHIIHPSCWPKSDGFLQLTERHFVTDRKIARMFVGDIMDDIMRGIV